MKKQILIILSLLMLLPLCAAAQDGLRINRLFNGKYRSLKNATEIIVTGEQAQRMHLNVYHSLSLTLEQGMQNEIEPLVVRDGAAALSKEVEYRSGKIYYGFYVLKPVSVKNGKGKSEQRNRYIFYLNQQLANRNPQNKVILIYMESTRDARYIKRLIRE